MAETAVTAAARPRVFPEPREAGLAAGVALGVAALAAADGGYYPTAWGWAGLIAAWLVAGIVLVGSPARPSRLELAFLGGMAGLAAWIWLSVAWSDDSVESVLEGQRVLLYATAALALVLVLKKRSVVPVLGGALGGLAIPLSYGLATRLFPDRLGVFDPIAGYRLTEPVGYWNGMGILAAMAALLALGVAARARSLAARGIAAALVVLLLATVYFTFGRGPWIALGLGLLAAIALDPRRLQLVAVGLGIGVPAGLGVVLASQYDALRREDAPIALAADEGERLALWLLLLAAAAAAVAVVFALAERRVELPRRVATGFAATLAVGAAVVVLGVVVRFGGPIDMVERAYDAFDAPPPTVAGPDLGERLFSFSGSYRVDLWKSAWRQYEANPVLGGGAGSFEQHWLADRPFEHKVRDAHSLYFETLSELGPLGLALLLLTLGVPVAAALVSRRHPLVPAAFAAYVAYLVHAGIDWDWELPALTVLALLCGTTMLASARRSDTPLQLGTWGRGIAVAGSLAIAAVVFVALVGNNAIAHSDTAADDGNWSKAESEARKAKRWAPWSSEPWQRLGEAQLGQGRFAAAEDDFREAIEREPRDFELWLDLARATDGAERAAALKRASELNPLSPEIEEFRAG
jgi:cytochrome c-type biogenesis protein CcmH/NrfG